MPRVYKILARSLWQEALEKGALAGAAIDLEDGYIHLSTAVQAPETARLHFRGQRDLVVLEFDSNTLGERLKWEPSRGGQLFPHFYGTLSPDDVLAVHAAPLDADGVPTIGPLSP